MYKTDLTVITVMNISQPEGNYLEGVYSPDSDIDVIKVRLSVEMGISLDEVDEQYEFSTETVWTAT